MSMKSINWNKLQEAILFLRGIASNARNADDAVTFIKEARDWFESERARLQALVKAKEWYQPNDESPDMFCTWCGNGPSIANSSYRVQHSHDCPAFEPNGEVK